MDQFVLDDVKNDETPADVVWHNIKLADERYNLQLFLAAAGGWFHLYPEKGFQDLERELRQRNMKTHLFAAKPTLQAKYKLMNPQKEFDTGLEFECMYSCRPAPHALKEVLQHSSSYEENFEKLAKSGYITLSDEKAKDVSNSDKVKIFSDEEKTDMQLLSENKRKLRCVSKTKDEIIAEIYTQCKERLGKEPTMALYSMGPNGQPIMAFVHEDSIVSNVGLMMDAVTNETKLVKIY
jgi:hypothetical protein